MKAVNVSADVRKKLEAVADTQIKAKDMLQSALGNGYMVALNLLPNSPRWLTSIGALPMYLGLDLRGGKSDARNHQLHGA